MQILEEEAHPLTRNLGIHQINYQQLPGLARVVLHYLLHSLFRALITELGVPIMLIRELKVRSAIMEMRILFRENMVELVVYALLRLAIALLSALIAMGIAMVLMMALCCVALIPFIGSMVIATLLTLIFLPLHVFNRYWAMHFLAELSDEYTRLIPVFEGEK